MNKIFTAILIILPTFLTVTAQIPVATGIQILKAEDARRYDTVLEGLLKSPNAAVRARAAIAAGRIGDKRAIPALAALFENRKNSGSVWTAAAFALGEIEAAEGGEHILFVLKAESGFAKRDKGLLSRAVEAAGKIIAANPKDTQLAELKSAIVRVMDDEIASGAPIREVVLSGITAILRARPDGGETVTAKFLNSPDARVRADALNTLTRLRSKQNLDVIRGLLRRDPDAVVRANAARVLGAAEDKEALPLLLDYAVSGDDLRVRVACIRALGSLKDAKAADKLIARGNSLMETVKKTKGPVPAEMNELLEIASVLGRLLPDSKNQQAIHFLNEFVFDDRLVSAESQIAMAAIWPASYAEHVAPKELAYANPRYPAAYAQGIATLATSKDENIVKTARENLRKYIAGMTTVKPADQPKFIMAMPELMRALAAFKPDNLDEILRGQLANEDPFLRAATADLIADRPKTNENIDALNSAYAKATITDKHENDALLSILDALVKLDKKAGVGSFSIALGSPDYLVRKKAYGILDDKDLHKDNPGLPTMLESEKRNHKDQVLAYKPFYGTKLGQVLNTDIDYRRALVRKNGSIRAIVNTEKGSFTIEFYPEDAPLTVDNWVGLARAGYFNGLEVHRVVPNFVMQDGDPRGDGNGGPGWSIRCEVNMREYDRGAVGMALSGKDTGGSQWFVTHSPQPHLDGGYTVFGHVSEADMTVVDKIVRGDKILKVTIIGK